MRNFEFSYVARVPTFPADAKLSRIWIPLPQTDRYQKIGALKIEAPFAYTQHRDPEYGNEYLYLETPATKLTASGEVRISFEVMRHEHRVDLNARPTNVPSLAADPPGLQRFLQPDRRVPLQGIIAELSVQETRGIQDPLAKARAIYNYVVATMRYDKSGSGWGNGDAMWACTAKRGNCTDFHSLFIRMMRAAGIPARFEIGFSLPTDQHDGVCRDITAGRSSTLSLTAGSRWMHQKRGSILTGRITSSGRTTTIACSLLSDEISGSTHLSRAIRSTISSILTRSWTESPSQRSPSSRSKIERAAAIKILASLSRLADLR
jgi:Transglutaminase-like superfamily